MVCPKSDFEDMPNIQQEYHRAKDTKLNNPTLGISIMDG